MYQLMLENGATDDELRQQLSGTGTPQSYLDREAQKAAAAKAAQPTYSLPSQWFNGMSRIGEAQGWKIDDSDTATWQQIAALANAGNTQGAINLANQLAAQGKFGGYYDKNGNYWGFAQGYTGGANASMQPVIGGKILTPKGLEAENTNVWLTPDGKALNYGQGGVLTDNGETWGTTDANPYGLTGRWYNEHEPIYGDIRDTTWTAWAQQQGWNPAETQQHMAEAGAFTNPALNTLAGNQQRLAELQANPNADPAAIANLQSYIQKQQAATPYQQVLNSYGSTPAGNFTPTQPVSYQEYLNQNGSKPASLSAPGAYDPNSDTLWQQYLKEYGNAKAPEWTGGDYDYTQNAAYQQYLKDWASRQAPEYAGDPYQAQRDAALAAYGEKWGGSEYQKLRDQYLRNAANMEWNFDPSTDPVWQAYQKQYRREGQRATEDTLGRYAAMTGGMPSTAAVTAASQAGDYYASQLSDKLPEVYQQAYQRYLQEYQRQLGLSDAYAGYDDREYQRWLQSQAQNLDLANAYNQYGQLDYQKYLDQLGQFNTDRNFNYGAAMDAINQGRTDYNTRYQQYLDQLGQFNTDRNFAYGAARDNQSLGRQSVEDQYKRYLDALSQANYEDETAYNRYRDTISDQRYDAEWAQQLREYADSQNWKATEWQQYLREYGDKLSQTEREWAMQQAQYADDKALAMAKLGAQYGDYSGLEGMGIDTSSANPKEVAYAADGSMYKFNSPDAQYFVQNAPNGTPGNPTTMTGGDGSIWRKDEYGGITITTKNGKTFTYSNPQIPETKNTGTYRYIENPRSTGDEDPVEESYIDQLLAAGIKSYEDAMDWLERKLPSKNYSWKKDIANGLVKRLEQSESQDAGTGDMGAEPATSGAQNVTPPTVNTRREAKDWLASVGVPADIAGRVPDEYDWQREHNTPGTDAYGFSTYSAFLNAYMKYLYANYGG